jgi:hypothetical protein
MTGTSVLIRRRQVDGSQVSVNGVYLLVSAASASAEPGNSMPIRRWNPTARGRVQIAWRLFVTNVAEAIPIMYLGVTRFPFPSKSPLPGDPDGKPAGPSRPAS